MAATYLSLTVDLPEQDAELCQSLLEDAGALGLEIRDAEAPPMPGVRGPARGEAIVIGFFDDPAQADEAATVVRSRLSQARAELAAVPDRDWSTEWRSLIRSVQVGRLWVGPPWEAATAPADKTRIVIEPKMAFGTGDHPTTTLCLEAVDGYLAAHPGASMLDVGTGTGVLAIAARKLGASRVVGVDNDEVSVALARENAQENGVAELELSGRTLADLDGAFDLVVANILANTLIALAPAITAKVKDRLVLAGVLVPQRAEVEAAYTALGLVAHGGRELGEWVRIELARR